MQATNLAKYRIIWYGWNQNCLSVGNIEEGDFKNSSYTAL